MKVCVENEDGIQLSTTYRRLRPAFQCVKNNGPRLREVLGGRSQCVDIWYQTELQKSIDMWITELVLFPPPIFVI
jgi:hypothetical protein